MSRPSGQNTRVLLVSVNTEDQPYPVYPLALDYLRAPLQQAGYDTRTWDSQFAQSRGFKFEEVLRSYDPAVALVSVRNADNNDAANTKNYLPDTLAMVAAIKNHTGAKVVLGGSGYSLFPDEILKASQADCGVMGPGEHIVVALVEALLEGTDPCLLPGLVYRQGDSCRINPPVPPSSARALLSRDRELVQSYWEQGGLPGVQLKRGCPYECVYCTYPLLEGRKFLQKDAAEVVDEIQGFYETAGVDQFFVVDSVMNAVPALARAFAEELCRRRLPVHWSGYFIPKGITRECVELWRASGLDGIEFGVDTLCPPLLKRWGKAFQLADLHQAAQACVETGMPYSMYLIFGGPGETQACPKAVVFGFLGMRIYPRTRLLDIARQEGVVRNGDNLLEPKFYISSQLDPDRLTARLAELGRQLNWLIVGPSLEKKTRAAARLRSRGRKGALWQELAPR